MSTLSIPAASAYVFERAVAFTGGEGRTTTRFIDVYKRGCFVLEAKQGSEAAATLGEPVLSQEMRAVRAGAALTAKEKATHEQGLVTVLREILAAASTTAAATPCADPCRAPAGAPGGDGVPESGSGTPPG